MHADDDRIICGRVISLDSRNTIAEAVAVRDGRVAAIGSRSDILSRRGPSTRVVETDGCIIPGFNDTHAHMDTEGLRAQFPSLGRVRSIGDALERIAALAREAPKGAWIVTMPVGDPPFYFGGPAVLAERRMPNRYELDRAAPENPVCILPPSSYWGLAPCFTALNSEGLRRNNIGRGTRARVEGIEIQIDASGEPTGIIIDNNYPDLAQVDVLPAVPRFTLADRRAGVLRSLKAYHAKGTTSVYEGHGCAPDILSTYRAMRSAGELTMRMGLVVSPTWRSLEDAERQMRDGLSYARGDGLGDPWLRISGVFINYGGDPSAAAVSLQDPSNLGWSCYVKHANDPATFEALCRMAARYDLRVHTVVIDRLQEILPVLQRVHAAFGIRHRRWVLEHISVACLDDLAGLSALGLGVTLIPDYHTWKAGGRFLGLPDAQQELVSPVHQLTTLGVPVAAGTDNSPYNPLAVIKSMMTRQERTTGRIVGPRARVDAETALRCMTVNGAWLTFEEGVKGPLVPGNYADLAVLDRDPLTIPGEEQDTITCVATMVGGTWVHGDHA